jgi:hypothetical protein
MWKTVAAAAQMPTAIAMRPVRLRMMAFPPAPAVLQVVRAAPPRRDRAA